MSAIPAQFSRVAIIGAGLLGTSVAHAVRRFLPDTVIQFADQDPEAVAVLREIFPEALATTNPVDAVRGADLVVLCVPVRAMAPVAQSIAGHLQLGTVVTDVGSVKRSVITDLSAALGPDVTVIAGHPVAGSGRSGPRAGFADLFVGRFVILTPEETVDADALERLSAFWKALGAMVEIMDADEHDLVLALTSHLPHLIAYTIVGTAADFEDVSESDVMRFSAGGFRDFTRIAASDPVMWRDIFLTNKDAVLEALGRFSEDLAALQRAIRWGEGDKLEAWFTRTRTVRQGIIDIGQDTAEADFGRRGGAAGDEGDGPVLKPYAND
ncbi:MAG: prephenate/arogenate dehydrogenase family protein [Devosiaceae bacterium]|nr:prephenate/arogenate dehydrogenase family protein [Devosiaceae bacterium MH13]